MNENAEKKTKTKRTYWNELEWVSWTQEECITKVFVGVDGWLSVRGPNVGTRELLILTANY